MKSIIFKFFAIALVTITIVSCNNDDDNNSTPITFNPTVLSSNVADLYETRGNVANDTAWIYVQGGPVVQRDYVFEEQYDDNTDLFPFITDDLRVYPFQVQQINDEITTFEGLTTEQAKVESAKNTEILKRVIDHLEAQNKTVYVIGHSYGSFIANDLLATYGQVGRKIASFNGRLDMNQVVWEGFFRGEEWLFDADGQNPTLNEGADSSTLEKNLRKIAGGLGFNRFTQRLANVDLSDAIFVTSTNDEFVGDFTQTSLDLLQAQSEALLVLNGGHSDIFDSVFFEQVHNIIIQDDIVVERQFGIFNVLNDDTTIEMNGEIGDNTLVDFNNLLASFPNVNKVNILEVPGSYNDEINLQVSLLIFQNEIATHILDNGLIALGGVDFFLAGTTRTKGNNTQIGVHSWGGEDANGNTVTATDFPVGHEYHLEYINYYVSIGFTQEDAEAFYYFTINAASADNIYWMTDTEVEQYNILTQ